jgi:Protein of unknown function (DUF3800)
MTRAGVLEINRAIHPLSSRLRITAVLKAYFDDSYDGKNERVFSVGGYVATEKDWGIFADEWGKRSGGAVFHMADLLCKGGGGDFRGWPEQKRFDLIKAMIETLNSVEVLGFHCPILLQEFRQVFPHEESDAPYFMCFQQCFNQAAVWAGGLQDNVACFFDLQNDSEYRAIRMFKHVQKLADLPGWGVMQWLASITYGSKRQYTPLQAADLIAYTGCKLLTELLDGRNKDALWWLDSMNAKGNLYGDEPWGRDNLLALKEEVRLAQGAGVIPYIIKKKGEAK